MAARRAGTRPRPTDRGVGRLSAVARVRRDTSENADSRTRRPGVPLCTELVARRRAGSRDISWAAGQLASAHAGALDRTPIASEPTAASNEGSRLVVHRRGPTRCPLGRIRAAAGTRRGARRRCSFDNRASSPARSSRPLRRRNSSVERRARPLLVDAVRKRARRGRPVRRLRSATLDRRVVGSV